MCQGSGVLQTGVIKQTSAEMEMTTEKRGQRCVSSWGSFMTLSAMHWWHLAAKRQQAWNTRLEKSRAAGAWWVVYSWRWQRTLSSCCDGTVRMTGSQGSLVTLIGVVFPSLLIPDIWEFGSPCSLQCTRALLSVAWKSPIAFIGWVTGWPVFCAWAVVWRVSSCCIRRARKWLKLAKLCVYSQGWIWI